jgi:transcriptional regulator GlxA family with amidase domain
VELLTKTNLSLAMVAERAGFKHQEYLGAVFRARLGRTPAQVGDEATQGADQRRPVWPVGQKVITST